MIALAVVCRTRLGPFLGPGKCPNEAGEEGDGVAPEMRGGGYKGGGPPPSHLAVSRRSTGCIRLKRSFFLIRFAEVLSQRPSPFPGLGFRV